MTGEEMRTIRKGMGMTQALFAQVAGVSQTFVGQMERGAKPISNRVAVAVLSCFHLTEAFRLGMKDNPENLASVVVEYVDGKSGVTVRLRDKTGQGVSAPMAIIEGSVKSLLYYFNEAANERELLEMEREAYEMEHGVAPPEGWNPWGEES